MRARSGGMGAGLVVHLLLASMARGLRIEPTGSPGLWTVRAGDSPDDAALRSIVSTSTAPVVIVYAASRDDPAALATVQLRGDDDDWLWSRSSESSGLTSTRSGELHVDRASSFDDVEITVHTKEQLDHVQAAGHGDLIVDHSVLVMDNASANVTVRATGTGDVYLPPQLKLHVATLSLASSSHGNLWLAGSDLDVHLLDVRVSNTGSVKLHASRLVIEDTAVVRVSGVGNAVLSASMLVAAQLNVTTTSSGKASIGTTDDPTSSASATQCAYEIRSVGDINAGRVACRDATVKNTGIGDVTVHVRDRLAYSISSFGNVLYAGTRPQTMLPTSGQHGRSVHAAAAFATPTRPSWADGYALPTHEPVEREAIARKDHNDEDDGDGERHAFTEPVAGESYATVSPTTSSAPDSSSTASHASLWRVVALMAVLSALLVAANSSCRQRRSRRGPVNEKSRLLESDEDDPPVYI